MFVWVEEDLVCWWVGVMGSGLPPVLNTTPALPPQACEGGAGASGHPPPQHATKGGSLGHSSPPPADGVVSPRLIITCQSEPSAHAKQGDSPAPRDP